MKRSQGWTAQEGANQIKQIGVPFFSALLFLWLQLEFIIESNWFSYLVECSLGQALWPPFPHHSSNVLE